MNLNSTQNFSYYRSDIGQPMMSTIPTLFLITLSIYSAGIATAWQIEDTRPILILYALWFFSAYKLIKQSSISTIKFSFHKSVLWNGVTLFLFALILSTIFVGLTGIRSDYESAVRQTGMVIASIIPFYILAHASSRLNFETPLIACCHSILIITGASIAFDFIGITNFENYNNRYFGFLSDGAPWALSFSLIVYLSTSRYTLSFLSFLLYGLTLSRGVAVVIASAVIIIAIYNIRKISVIKVIFLATLIFAVIFLGMDQLTLIIDRFTEIDIKSDDRTITSINGINVFLKSPIYGSGYNSLAYYYPPSFIKTEGEGFAVPASTFIQILSDGGIITFIAYLTFITSITLNTIKTLKTSIQNKQKNLVMGMAAWLLPMLWLNHSAAWILPNSFLSPLVFSVAGLITGFSLRQKDNQNYMINSRT